MDGAFDLEINSPKYGKHTFRCPLDYEQAIRSRHWTLSVMSNGHVSAVHSANNKKMKGSITLGRFVYELTGRIIPFDHIVTFRDGNSKNCLKGNLFTLPKRMLSSYVKVRTEKKGMLRDQEQP